MWLQKFINKETRTQVPKFTTFLYQNQDLLKLFYEDQVETAENRIIFPLRVLRFITHLTVLFVFVYTVISPEDYKFSQICKQRLECFSSCSKAYFPNLFCQPQPWADFYYNWNHYNNLYLFSRPDPILNGQEAVKDYNLCKSYIVQNSNYAQARGDPKRQVRTHTCFSYCLNGDDPAVLGEDRPECIDLAPALRDQILCVKPDDYCEQTTLSGEINLSSNPAVDISFSPVYGIYAVIVATPVIFIFEVLSIYLQKIVINQESAKQNFKILMFQIFVTAWFVYFLFQSIKWITVTIAQGRPALIFITFTFAFIVDQVKQLAILGLVYQIIVRRFGFLKENEKEWLVRSSLPEKTENQIPKFQAAVLKTLEANAVEMFSLSIISIYTVIILFDLAVAESLNVNPNIMSQIDFAFLTFFFVEIILKIFASNGLFMTDFFNGFDAVIVIISYIFSILGITAKGLAVLRLIRVVVITIRKITGNTNKLRHASKNANPVDSVIKILLQLQNLPEISNSLKKEAKFAIQIIESNRLYDLNLDQNSDEKNMDMEAKAWINMTTDAVNDTSAWFERDLEDFLKELHREAEELDPNQIEEEEERLRQIVTLNTRTWTNLMKMMDQFDKWEFDVFAYVEVLYDQSLHHFGFKLFQQYGLLEKFSIADQNFNNLLTGIKQSTYEQNSYHNITRIIEVTRNFHYFTKTGELMEHFSDLNILAGFLACFCLDVAHPGVNNPFLIAMKHTKALRYNDKNVLENHHCAIAFKLLLDPQNDIFELLSEAQYWNVRLIITNMILSSDISNHFDQIMTFKSRLASKKFPDDNNYSDKQLILNLFLFASDHCSPCKFSILYFKWLAVEMEEYYQQGDLERKLDFTITNFFDRTTCNPFKYQLGYIDVIVMPVFKTIIEFKEVYAEDCMNKGLIENRRLIEQKVEETKALMNQRDLGVARESIPVNTMSPQKPSQIDTDKAGVQLQVFSPSSN